MDAMLALNLLSVGGNVVNRVVDACASIVDTATSSSATDSFTSVLKTEISSATSKYALMDATALSDANLSLQKDLCKCEDLKDFIGDDKSFKVRNTGDGYVIERSDGRIWKIPEDSKAASIAKDFCDCSVAQSRKGGQPITGLRSTWTVTVEA